MTGTNPVHSHEPEVICLGEALVDRLGPLGGDPAVDQPVEDCLGGAPANVACGLARLGRKVAFVGRLGDDAIGARFRELFDTRGVNLAGLQIDQRRPSRIVLVRRDLDGERVFQGFAGDRGDGFADQSLSLDALAASWPLLVGKASWLLIGSIPLATPASAQSLLWCVEQAQTVGLEIALDVNWRPTFWDPGRAPDSGPDEKALQAIAPLLERASLLKLAREEAVWFFDTDDPAVIARSLPQQPDVVVTDGARPVRWWIGGCVGELAALSPPSVLDTTGAGDAFTAGLLHQFLMDASSQGDLIKAREMVRFAAACGALVCGGAGGIDPQPSQMHVEEFLGSFAGEVN
ncbi:2-dehydro-3-deoxygluconokinase [Prochlorococcus marinus str. MIT 1313]|uniref:carbohydrate kinase family protein n=1 Tax=Prochlorococcus TaxID=1218 RepID=UPI0007B3D073|nr:carbohydrate kinase [Prochlorococcus marinus]KZR72037.1 2-dehydro-3-deoxygluconokinase [Prochlorococcus marinus str. MIT 1313]KZR74597.1 2-dehydro-3-deoxygluconokinase [Prochlorococcus marinus str. MIT 1318]